MLHIFGWKSHNENNEKNNILYAEGHLCECEAGSQNIFFASGYEQFWTSDNITYTVPAL